MYYDALMLKEGNLTKAEKEMIVVATSSANNCMYCIVAHGALLRIYSKNPLLGDQVKIMITVFYQVLVKSIYPSLVTHLSRAYPCLCRIQQLRVFLIPLDHSWDACGTIVR